MVEESNGISACCNSHKFVEVIASIGLDWLRTSLICPYVSVSMGDLSVGSVELSDLLLSLTQSS